MTRGLVFCGFALLSLVVLLNPLNAQDEPDSFVLPETPPTIEHMLMPQLDRPILKKQNIVPDSSVELSRVWPEVSFKPFIAFNNPLSVTLFGGSYGKVGSDFRFASKNTVFFELNSLRCDGENSAIAFDETKAGFLYEKTHGERLLLRSGAETFETSFGGLKKTRYGAEGLVKYFVFENLNIQLGAKLGRSEIKSSSLDESADLRFVSNWQPFRGQNVEARVSRTNDSAFSNMNTVDTAGLEYCFQIFGFDVSGGADYSGSSLFPNGTVSLMVFERGKISVAYGPGFEKPDYNELHIKRAAVLANPALLMPEKETSFTESFSYYILDKLEGQVTFSQDGFKNFVYSESSPLNIITPQNIADIRVSRYSADFSIKDGVLRPGISASGSFKGDIPFVPVYALDTHVGAVFSTLKLVSGLKAVSSVKYSLSSQDRLPAYLDMYFKVEKTLLSSLTVSAGCGNMLSQRIVLQPGYEYSGADFDFGITYNF